jgi:ATP-dependent Clp protease ATP-binding subunit ClpX
MKTPELTNTCSFCGKHKDVVTKLIVSDEVAICNDCVDLCQTLLTDEKPAVVPTATLDPFEIKKHLDQFVIGQHRAKQVLSVAIVNHYKRVGNQDPNVEIEKTNILMLGPTGSGKTLLARSVARYLDVPFVIADATSLTEAGYVGDDVESLISRLFAASGNDVEKTQRGIVFIDEIDKISRKSESASITRDVSGEGVQQALLKLVEGTKCRITPQGGRKHPSGDTVEIDTRNILFIAGGAFVGMEAVIKSRVKGTSIGFGAQVGTEEVSTLDQVTPDDLVRFGMIPEFVGRFQSWVALNELSKDDLIRILTEIKYSYISQYHWLFEQDSVELNFTTASLELIAERTMKNKTGARGLHSELERVLLPHMFHLAQYRKQGITVVDIDTDQVLDPVELQVVNS